MVRVGVRPALGWLLGLRAGDPPNRLHRPESPPFTGGEDVKVTRPTEAIDLDALYYHQPTTAVGPGALPILDSEPLAVDGVPVKDLVPLEDEWMPGQWKVRQSWREDPFWPLVIGTGVLVTGIVGTLIYGIVQIMRVVSRAVPEYAPVAGGGLVLLLLLGLLGAADAVCAGLHCAGCRR